MTDTQLHTRQNPAVAPKGQGRFWIIVRYILPGFVLGAGAGFWVANSSKVLSEETAVLAAAAAADVSLLALTLAAITFVIAFLDGFFGDLIESYGIRNFFFPFVLVAFVSTVSALVSFAGALDNGTGPAWSQDVLFGAATWLTVWAIVGAFGLVLTLVFYTDERARLSGIPKKFPRPSAAATAPNVTGVNPTSGEVVGGDTVTVTGSGFTGATEVSFGTIAASSPVVVSDNQLTVTSPPAPAGTVHVSVTTPAGTSAATPADHFTYS